jgi:hypothetical protein
MLTSALCGSCAGRYIRRRRRAAAALVRARSAARPRGALRTWRMGLLRWWLPIFVRVSAVMRLAARAMAALRALCGAPPPKLAPSDDDHDAPAALARDDAGAAPPPPPPCCPQPPPPDGERILAGPPPSRGWVAVTLQPPADCGAAAQREFTFRGVRFALPRHARGRATLALAPSTTAATLLDFCAVWLGVPAASLSIAGAELVLSSSSPRRTVAEARLGADAGAAPPPVRRVFALPWCAICLSAASGALWSCRGGIAGGARDDDDDDDDDDGADAAGAAGAVTEGVPSVRHRFCAACVRRYVATALSVRSAATLRCPAPGCLHTLEADELAQLVDLAALRTARAARTAQHAARLRAVAAGAEGPELAALLARGGACACPGCAVLIQKAGGCRHMVCSVCGVDFQWE